MKRYGWKFFILIILASLVFVWLIRAPLISSYLSKKLRIEISIRWIGVWPTYMNIHGFAVKNPPGYHEKAFKAEEITCRYNLGQLLGNPTVIDSIEIKNPVLRIDFTNPLGTANNWTALAERMPERKSRSNVVIRKLILTNFNVEIYGANLLVKPKQTHFDRLEFDEIDSQQGFPTARLIRMIFQSSGIDQYLQDLFNPEQNIQNLLSPQKIFGL